MEQLKVFVHKRLFILVILVVIGSILGSELPIKSFLELLMGKEAAYYMGGIVLQGSISVILFLILKSLGLKTYLGLHKGIGNFREMILGWPFLILIIINMLPSLTGDMKLDFSKPMIILLFSLLHLTTGLFEELLIRGVVLGYMLYKWPGKIYTGVIGSSLVFGIAHLANVIMGRMTLEAVMVQIVYGACIGIFFAAWFLRSSNLWTTIIGHALFNFAGSLGELMVGYERPMGAYDASLLSSLIEILIIMGPFVFYGLYLLRKVDGKAIKIVA